MTGRIFEIKRFAVHDGDGVRTTVFFKGCPLRCLWCHNPEGLSAKKELALFARKCLFCGACAASCRFGAHEVAPGTHSLAREKCVLCGACAAACPAEALTLYGEDVTVNDLLPRLMEDRDFYENSGGGVTLSGGECLLQADFCAELLAAIKKEGIRTAVDTCGAVPQSAIEKVLPFADVFLYDLKAASSELHRALTGEPNERILSNLRFLVDSGAKIEIRVPFVPEKNGAEMEAIAELVASLDPAIPVRVLAYHDLARSRYAALGTTCLLP